MAGREPQRLRDDRVRLARRGTGVRDFSLGAVGAGTRGRLVARVFSEHDAPGLVDGTPVG